MRPATRRPPVIIITADEYLRALREAIEDEMLVAIEAAEAKGDDDLAFDLECELDELLDRPLPARRKRHAR
jgi:hypothetical protein